MDDFLKWIRLILRDLGGRIFGEWGIEFDRCLVIAKVLLVKISKWMNEWINK